MPQPWSVTPRRSRRHNPGSGTPTSAPREIEERTSTGVTLATFVWGPEHVDSLVQFERTSLHPKGAGTYFVHTDSRFDVVAVTDHNGIVVEKRHYDDFGAMTFTLGGQAGASSIGLAYGFQGRRHDAETGLIFFRARYYEPSTGRFVSRDPVWDPTSLGNQYTFAGNAPTTLMDPSGEFVPVAVAAFAAYAAWTAVNTAVDTAIEYGMSRAFGGEFNLGQSLAVNGIINAVTGGFGGKIAKCAKFARMVGARYAINYTLRSVADAALTSGAELVVKGETNGWGNLIGGFVGHGVGDVFEAGLRRIVKACFLAGTLVETRDGRKTIESLREGDEVLSRDERTGEQGYKPVVQLFRGHTDKVAHVRVAEVSRPTQRGRTERHRVGVASTSDESGEDDSDPDPAGPPAEQTIRSTVGHPYYVLGRGWVPAQGLSPGDQLVGSRDETLVVVGVEVRAEQADHFNFEVGEWHTYFVAGDVSAPAVWVHNRCDLAWRAAHRERLWNSGRAQAGGVRGMSGAGEVAERMGALRSRLAAAGITDAQVGIRGSSVTGVSSKGGAFRWRRTDLKKSDVDFFVTSPTIDRRFGSLMVEGRLKPEMLERVAPELFEVLEDFGVQTTRQLGRGADATFLSRGLVESLNPADYVRGW